MLRKHPPVDPVLSCLSCFRKPSVGVCQVVSNSPDPGIAKIRWQENIHNVHNMEIICLTGLSFVLAPLKLRPNGAIQIYYYYYYYYWRRRRDSLFGHVATAGSPQIYTESTESPTYRAAWSPCLSVVQLMEAETSFRPSPKQMARPTSQGQPINHGDEPCIGD